MTVGRTTEEQLRLEVVELTDLLRHAASFADLREVLAAKRAPASETILAGLIEGDDESRYGVFLTPTQECVLFETAPDGRLTRWEIIEDLGALTDSFEAVSTGITMKRAGEIS
jgi:hypothetical protein